MIWWGCFALTCLAVGCALRWYQLWQRCRRALDEWAARWEQAPERCALPGCAQLSDAACHVEWDFDDAVMKGWGKHRFVPGRLVAVPVLPAREGGRER
jgi:hypothetical protein